MSVAHNILSQKRNRGNNMSDFLSSAKNFVNSAVSRTSWEAQKQLRVRNKQSEIDKLVEQRQRLMDELGQVTLNLYQQGSLTDTQLSRICAGVFELDHDLRSRETQMQEVKNEPYPTDQLAPDPMVNYGPPSSATPPPPPSGAGAPPPSGAGAPPPSGTGASNAQPQHCPHCGSTLRTNSLSCRSCGSKVM
jgi:hypothetical protein